MATNDADSEHEAGRTHVLVSVASEIFMVCATVLLFFVHLELPVTIAAFASIAALFLFSLLIWQSYNGAKIVLLFSLVAMQLVFVRYSPMMMVLFVLMDLLIIAVMLLSWKNSKD
ncbi:TPA: hypothetical protein HA225_04450 [Candidatus Micrarchaeota archaeon]|nr:hypothetical protein [Candidatus Micrarchaeota archaeon]HIH30194.1 hypothetical protein [Candidatus Micrarchaeota archaeon]